jgi:uracil-DNA glycosylase
MISAKEEKLVKIEKTWKNALIYEFNKPYFKKLRFFVRDAYKNKIVFPNPKNIFRAFDLCPFDDVKVVILGQDPYHGKGQANGLSFAVNSGVALPPSLKNIFKEIQSDLNITPSPNGDLLRWATQGVLLLNSSLTVEMGSPGSHQKIGWEDFTDCVIKTISEKKEKIVFVLWGNYARQKGVCIDRSKHLVLESAHPSPFSAYNGFFGSKPFSKANAYLKQWGLGEVDWR